jgi:hypothetical protein
MNHSRLLLAALALVAAGPLLVAQTPEPKLAFPPPSPKAVGKLTDQMIGYNLVTKQTTKEGVTVKNVRKRR